jgi:hypothetical protein
LYVVGGAVVVDVIVVVGSVAVEVGEVVDVVVNVVVVVALLAVSVDRAAGLELEHAPAKKHMSARASRVVPLGVHPIA